MNEVTKKALLAFQSIFNDFDASIWDQPVLHTSRYPQPIFIVSPPRTGSTLLYQLLIQQYQCAYISNLMAAFPKYMIRLCRRWPAVAQGHGRDVRTAYYGYVPGFFGPSEAGMILRRWFDDQATPRHDEAVRRTFDAIAMITGAPALLKNLNNSLRIAKIRQILPDSRFIVIRRDPRFTAQSILLARRAINRDPREWWSVEVPGYRKVLSEDPIYQCLWQILEIEATVSKGLADAGPRAVEVSYEAMCQQPGEILSMIGERFELRKRPNAPALTAPLGNANKVRLSGEEWRQLEHHHEILDTAARGGGT